MNKLIIFVISFVVSMHAFLIPSGLAEKAEIRHAEIKKSYFRLKNIDPAVKDYPAWLAVIESYDDFIKTGEGLNEKVYYEYANLLQDFAFATGDIESLDSAKIYYEKVYEKYPHSSVSDDAMLGRIEILKKQGISAKLIYEAYQEIIEVYPSSDSAEVARIRLSAHTQAENSTVKHDRQAAVSDTNKGKEHLPLVVIDAGHGGEDFGAESEAGLLEKDVALAIALEVERHINAQDFARIMLTRRSDKFVPLPERIALANDNKAAVFLSIHNNASPNASQNGLATYILDDTSDEASRLLAERENRSMSAGADGSDLDFIVSDLVQSSKNPKSVVLAESVNRSVLSSVRALWPEARSLGVKRAPFYVLVGAHMPCALTELFYLDHGTDGERLSDPEIRHAIAAGIAAGIRTFLEKSGG